MAASITAAGALAGGAMSGMGGGGSGSKGVEHFPQALDASGMLYHNMRGMQDAGGSLPNFYNRYGALGQPSRGVQDRRDRYMSSLEPHLDYNKYRENVIGSMDMQAGAAGSYLDKIVSPALTNRMTAMGMGRSGAIGENLAMAGMGMALPLAQMRSQWEMDAPRNMMGMTAANQGGMDLLDMERQSQLQTLKNQQGLYQMGQQGMNPLFNTTGATSQQSGPGMMAGMADSIMPASMLGMMAYQNYSRPQSPTPAGSGFGGGYGGSVGTWGMPNYFSYP